MGCLQVDERRGFRLDSLDVLYKWWFTWPTLAAAGHVQRVGVSLPIRLPPHGRTLDPGYEPITCPRV